MSAIIEWTPSPTAPTISGINAPTQQMYVFPVGGDMADWLELREPLVEGTGANVGRYQAD
jgi:hypothetical protein